MRKLQWGVVNLQWFELLRVVDTVNNRSFVFALQNAAASLAMA